jgi:hypothetical protein
MLNYPELQKSGLVLYDIAAFYLPLYGRTWEDFFDFFAPLALVEGLIYQVEIAIDQHEPFDWVAQEAKIRDFLQSHDLWSAPIQRYLSEVGQYFAIVKRVEGSQQTVDVSTSYLLPPTDIINAAELRPSDIRLLHAMIVRLLNEPHDEELFTLLWPLENLLDLKANLTEYQADAITGHYNTYNLAVKLYGDKAAEFIQTQQTRYHTMLQTLELTASANNLSRYRVMCQRHEEAYPAVPIPDSIK